MGSDIGPSLPDAATPLHLAASGAPTPVETGTQDLTVSVTVVYEIA